MHVCEISHHCYITSTVNPVWVYTCGTTQKHHLTRLQTLAFSTRHDISCPLGSNTDTKFASMHQDVVIVRGIGVQILLDLIQELSTLHLTK